MPDGPVETKAHELREREGVTCMQPFKEYMQIMEHMHVAELSRGIDETVLDDISRDIFLVRYELVT